MKKYIIPTMQVMHMNNHQFISTSDPNNPSIPGTVEGNDDDFGMSARGRRGFWNDEEFDY